MSTPKNFTTGKIENKLVVEVSLAKESSSNFTNLTTVPREPLTKPLTVDKFFNNMT